MATTRYLEIEPTIIVLYIAYMDFLLTVLANNDRSPRYMEKAIAAIHQTLPRSATFSVGFKALDGHVSLFMRSPEGLSRNVLDPIQANYPQCSISEHAIALPPADQESCAFVRLVPEIFPILRHAQFEDPLANAFADPLGALLFALSDDDIDAVVEISLRRAGLGRIHRALNAVKILDRQFFRTHHRLARIYASHATRHGRLVLWFLGRLAKKTPIVGHTILDTTGSRIHDREDDIQAASDKVGGHLFEATIRISVRSSRELKAKATTKIRSISGAMGTFTRPRLATFKTSRPTRFPARPHPVPFLINHEELATLWHPPTATVATDRLHVSEFQELPPPFQFHSERESGGVVLGQVRHRDDRRPVVLGIEDRRRHLYIVGKTGMGKTTLLQNMILHDITAKRGVCLIDPHGDLAESVIGQIPKQRTNDVILFDPASKDCGVGFNPLACPDPSRIDQVTSGVVSAFKKLHDSWGPRLEDTLRNAVFAIVEQGGDLLSVMRILGEKSFREQVVPNIRDEIVRSFWMHEFAGWSDNYRTEAVAAIQNKIRPFLTNTNIRAIVSNQRHSMNLRKIMDEKKVLIVNLSKGRLGEDNSTLLGAFLVTSIQQASMTRADIPEEERQDFSLFVDEFQNFTTGSFDAVLSEARKYRLSLIVAHQYIAQLNQETAAAVFGNVGSIITFQLGSDDAEILAQQLGKFAGQIKAENLTGLPKYTAYARLLIDGMPSNPFSIQTLPPQNEFDGQRAEIVRRQMLRRYSPHSSPSINRASSVLQDVV